MNVKLKAKQKNIRSKFYLLRGTQHTLVAFREYFTSLLVAVPTHVLEQNFLL